MAAAGLVRLPLGASRLRPAAHRVLARRALPARTLGTLAAEVLKSSEEGLLLLPSQASSEAARAQDGSAPAARGSVLRHGGRWWVCTFEVDRYWFASPLCDADPGPASGAGSSNQQASGSKELRWLCRRGAFSGGLAAGGAWPHAAVECLRRPTPTQVQRAPLSHGLPTGVVAVDVLAPLGLGQSLLICGARGAGKSTLAREVLEYVLTTRPADKAMRFCSDPCSPLMGAALHRVGSLSELVVTAAAAQAEGQGALVAPLFAAVGAAEAVRDAGEHALLVLDTVEPLLRAWDLAAEWAEALRGAPLDAELAATQRRALFAGLFERAAKLARGGSLTLLAMADSEALAAVAGPSLLAAAGTGAAALSGDAATYKLADFEGRRASELERLQRLVDRGVALTDAALKAVGISPPSPAGGASPAAQGSVMRELQSLSDGQIVLDLAAASAGDFPAVVPGATFSRFGLGSTGGASAQPAPLAAHERRDVRPPALQAVAAHLRTNLALEREAQFRPHSGPADGVQSAHMKAVRATLLQPPRAPLEPEEMTALLLLACGGALGALPEEEAAAALRGGSSSPLLQHLREAAPAVLRRIAEEDRPSRNTVRELEVSARVYVALQKAKASQSSGIA
mmetsp:Transcript_106171/g.327683  ORF Transcript_106171/g.327683 Transcript_106171/m.327683 type:complete len:626 (+) Transcript_106171:23-1900(+)